MQGFIKTVVIGLTVVAISVGFSGCAKVAAPNAVNGKYYMGGDSNCVKFRQLSPNRIMCINEDGEESGYRNAMTNQELQMYMHNQQIQAQADQNALNMMNYNTQQQINRNNAWFQQNSQNFYNSQNSYYNGY